MRRSADKDCGRVGVLDHFLPPLRSPASELPRQPLCRRQVDVRHSYEPITVGVAQRTGAAPTLETRAPETYAHPLRHALLCLSAWGLRMTRIAHLAGPSWL